MASIGNAFKVNAGVSVASGGTYNCPANSWALVTVSNTTVGVLTFTIAGRTLQVVGNGSVINPVVLVSVGPSQAMVLSAGLVAAGVEFLNS